ncbi:toxin YoeB [Chitinophaga ginsengisegetis]|uniref:Toxin YoeB n=1 Tax=Chitinophaga ginsengisegetis TaxID=393003 RepID=A0A1T5PCI8_9BACT|nr:Txe/YoeB family addiction module toxin [Chitinophaga ginsengisegetis]MDR6570153.1 toxin YoeB [Chitinophaga ginsengisegetis]MDR6649887.1 toxin YoeB [Chitinophaga ginsengisegetis]MDR6656472.1 toxin YoeB [Chitinophaga ginsengisegetis]SKD10470.1 toxin YoeB [Chitinophaga ginsengisegetis]
MTLTWDSNAWEDYLYWQQNDRKIMKKINELLKDTMRQPFEGLGKPELLKENLAGCWSRRIDQEHRLVYKVIEDSIYILQCRYHY